MSMADVDHFPVHRPPSLQLDATRRRDSSTSPTSPFPLSSSVFESDSDFRSQSSASLRGSISPSEFPSSGLPSIAEAQGSTSSTPTKKRTSSQPATLLDTPLRQSRHSLSSSSTMSLPTSSPNKPASSTLDETTIVIPDLGSSTSSLNMQLGDFTASSLALTTSSMAAMTVRDFAYDESDERHYGKGLERQGQPEPKPDSPRREPFQTNWGFGQAVEHDVDLDHGPYPAYEEEQDLSETEWVPGWYRCLYDFVPEGPAEMAMTAGEVYRIISRCGPVGWVIALNEDGTTGIVPEGYVTLERMDEDFEEERELPPADPHMEEDMSETPTASETPTSPNGSGEDDAPPTPHAEEELARAITPAGHDGEKPQLEEAAKDNGTAHQKAEAASHPSAAEGEAAEKNHLQPKAD